MTTWISSDPHFGHAALLVPGGVLDKPNRPFASIEEHDRCIIDKHNALVRPTDWWVCLGDVCMPNAWAAAQSALGQMHGRKSLVLGNHDELPMVEYLGYFSSIASLRVMADVIFSHAPLAPWTIGKRLGNAHGHTHMATAASYKATDNMAKGWAVSKPYANLSMERINYAPRTLEQVVASLRQAAAS